MSIRLDFTGVEGGDFEPIPAGNYTVEIEKCEATQSSSGNDMLKMQFNVVEGEYEGRKIFDNYVLTPKALWKLKSLLVALGEEVDGLMDINPDDLVGQVFEATVSIEESPGYDPTNRIKKHKKSEGIFLA